MKHYLLSITFCFAFLFEANACKCLMNPYEFKSAEHLDNYDFIAFVKIDSIYKSDLSAVIEHSNFYQADITIIDLFRGKPSSSILVSGGNEILGGVITSCDMGIDENEEWVIFANETKHEFYITHRCTYSKQYSNNDGEKDWQYERGIKELVSLKQIFGHEELIPIHDNGKSEIRYPNGNIEIEVEYKNGFVDGRRTVYWHNGKMMIDEYYDKGKRSGKSLWYGKNGIFTRDFNFYNGHPIDTCYYYFSQNGQVASQQIYGQTGVLLKRSNYRFNGTMRTHYSVGDSISTTWSYYESGAISSIALWDLINNEALGENGFYENGSREKKWEYYPKDSTRIMQFWWWDENGKLIDNFYNDSNGVKINLIKK